MKVLERRIFGIVVVVLLALFVILSLGYLPQARLVPLVIGIPSLALMLVELLWGGSRRKAAGFKEAAPLGDGDGEAPGITIAKELTFIGWIAGFALLIWLVGFAISIPLFIFLITRFQFRESLLVSGAASLGVLVVLYLAFDILLKVPMHFGLLFNL